MNIKHNELSSNQHAGLFFPPVPTDPFYCIVHIDSSLSSRSPEVYRKELPLAIADATADFKKSIKHQVKMVKSDVR